MNLRSLDGAETFLLSPSRSDGATGRCIEFERLSFFQKGAKGRVHNPDGFICWLAGAGLKTGVGHGETDPFGQKVLKDVHPLYDFNATILHLLGMDHERLTFEHDGIARRLTNVDGCVIREILS